MNPFQTFERRDIGLQLRVKPQISEGGVVRLAIYQELSSIQNTLTAAQGGIITNKRSFESMVLVEDGNIVVLGGLIEDKTDNSRSQVPILGSIPLIGELFKYENRKRTKTNLLVFLRPYVVRDEATSSALALDRYDYIRGQVANSTVADNLIFRDLQSRQIPERPPLPPRSSDPRTPRRPPRRRRCRVRPGRAWRRAKSARVRLRPSSTSRRPRRRQCPSHASARISEHTAALVVDPAAAGRGAVEWRLRRAAGDRPDHRHPAAAGGGGQRDRPWARSAAQAA